MSKGRRYFGPHGCSVSLISLEDLVVRQSCYVCSGDLSGQLNVLRLMISRDMLEKRHSTFIVVMEFCLCQRRVQVKFAKV
jgi:hypothetical protein